MEHEPLDFQFEDETLSGLDAELPSEESDSELAVILGDGPEAFLGGEQARGSGGPSSSAVEETALPAVEPAKDEELEPVAEEVSEDIASLEDDLLSSTLSEEELLAVDQADLELEEVSEEEAAADEPVFRESLPRSLEPPVVSDSSALESVTGAKEGEEEVVAAGPAPGEDLLSQAIDEEMGELLVGEEAAPAEASGGEPPTVRTDSEVDAILIDDDELELDELESASRDEEEWMSEFERMESAIKAPPPGPSEEEIEREITSEVEDLMKRVTPEPASESSEPAAPAGIDELPLEEIISEEEEIALTPSAEDDAGRAVAEAPEAVELEPAPAVEESAEPELEFEIEDSEELLLEEEEEEEPRAAPTPAPASTFEPAPASAQAMPSAEELKAEAESLDDWFDDLVAEVSAEIPEEGAAPATWQEAEQNAASAPSAAKEETQAVSRARRIARTIAQDIKNYHPEKVREGIEKRAIRTVLHTELKRSERLYRERVSADIDPDGRYFHDAVLQILADGYEDLLG